MNRVARRITVSGRVQGVFFRDWTVAEATRCGVSGWIRNLRDGRVEIVAAGEPAALDALVEACRRGPERARVDDVAVGSASDEGWAGFERRRDG